MLLEIILALFFIILTSTILFLAYSGAFSKAQIQRGNLEPLKFLYAKYIGDYKKIGDVQQRIRNIAQQAGIKNDDLKIICMFYDCPQDTDPENQKAIVGFCIDSLSQSKKEELIEYQYLIYGETQKCQSFYIAYPYKNDLISLYFGIKKSYPLLSDHIIKNQFQNEFHVSVEVYHKGLIYFHFPISNAQKLLFYQK